MRGEVGNVRGEGPGQAGRSRCLSWSVILAGLLGVICFLCACGGENETQSGCKPIGCPCPFALAFKPESGVLASGYYELDITADSKNEVRTCQVPASKGFPPCASVGGDLIRASAYADESGIGINFLDPFASVSVTVRFGGSELASSTMSPTYVPQPLGGCSSTCPVAASETVTF
jgi:hypothetical protein